MDIEHSAGATRPMAHRTLSRSGAVPTSPCVAVEAAGATFTLYPPTPFAIHETNARFKLVLPFGRALVDITIGDDACIRRQLRPGDLVIAQPGSSLTFRHVEPVEFLLALIDPDMVQQIAQLAAGNKWHLRDMAPWHDPSVAALSQEMRRVMISEALPLANYLSVLASALIARVAIATANESTRSSRELIVPAILARVVRYVETQLAESIEVSELADIAGLSVAHFARTFASATGETPHRFVMKRRVCRARDMLADGGASLAEIAASTGFASQAHMSTAFSREVGLSPARYRAAFRHEQARVFPTKQERSRTGS